MHRAHAGIWDVLFCVEIMEFGFSLLSVSQWPIFFLEERLFALKPMKLCQIPHPSVACLPCGYVPFCVWVNCGSGGIPAPPYAHRHTHPHTHTHTDTHTNTHRHTDTHTVFLSLSLSLCLPLSPQNSHTPRPVVCSHLTAPLRVRRRSFLLL